MSFWFFSLDGVSSSFFTVLDLKFGPLDPGLNIFANISLSRINTLFAGKAPDPTFVAVAWIDSWTFYRADGSESEPQTGEFTQNGVFVQDCATINFKLAVERVAASAQISASTV